MERDTVLTEDDLPPQVLRAIALGRKVEAIKLLQDATGLGFANAKVLVDNAARHYAPRTTRPAFVQERTSVPLLLGALLLAAAAFAVYHYYFGA